MNAPPSRALGMAHDDLTALHSHRDGETEGVVTRGEGVSWLQPHTADGQLVLQNSSSSQGMAQQFYA
jgi:hypothetical protein